MSIGIGDATGAGVIRGRQIMPGLSHRNVWVGIDLDKTVVDAVRMFINQSQKSLMDAEYWSRLKIGDKSGIVVVIGVECLNERENSSGGLLAPMHTFIE